MIKKAFLVPASFPGNVEDSCSQQETRQEVGETRSYTVRFGVRGPWGLRTPLSQALGGVAAIVGSIRRDRSPMLSPISPRQALSSPPSILTTRQGYPQVDE